MADLDHSVLSGSNLHEPKGVAAAVANRVYVSNGTGSGSWSQVPDAAIVAAAKPFQSQLYHIRDSAASGSPSQGALTNSTWNTRRLQTEITDEITASVTSNQISLPSGTYWLEGFAVVRCITNVFSESEVMNSKLRLRNITDSTTLVVSLNQNFKVAVIGSSTVDTANSNVLRLNGRFVVGAGKLLELQNYIIVVSGSPTADAGIAVSSGENEIYAEMLFWKIA